MDAGVRSCGVVGQSFYSNPRLATTTNSGEPPLRAAQFVREHLSPRRVCAGEYSESLGKSNYFAGTLLAMDAVAEGCNFFGAVAENKRQHNQHKTLNEIKSHHHSVRDDRCPRLERRRRFRTAGQRQ